MEEQEATQGSQWAWEVVPSPSTAVTSLAALATMQEQGQLCDVMLETGTGDRIQVHRSVLAACSDYFRAMFVNDLAESNQKTILFKDIDFDILEAVVSYAYNRKFVLSSEKALLLLVAADMFQIRPLLVQCSDFLETQVRTTNCLSLQAFADLYNCEKLFKHCSTFVAQNFENIVQTDNFLSLPFNQLKKMISKDDIRVTSEDQVYRAVVQWVYHNLEQRKEVFSQLISCVRFPFVSLEFLTGEVEQEQLMYIGDSCQEYLREAYLYKESPEKRPLLDKSQRMQPRKLSGLQEAILVVGGMSKSQPLSSVEQYDERIDSWETITNMEVPRYGLAACTLGGRLFVVGGYNDGFGYLNTVESYSLKDHKWSMVAPMLMARRYHAVVVLHGLIYAVGGQSTNGVLESVERYDPANDTWDIVAPLATQRMYHGLTEVNKQLFAIGGHDGRVRLRSIKVYDPANQWRAGAALSSPRSVVGVASLGHIIYVVGGYDGREYLDTVEQYDTETGVWFVGAHLSTCRSALGLVAYRGCLYACGGFGGRFLSSVECYGRRNHSWSPALNMLNERVHFGITST